MKAIVVEPFTLGQKLGALTVVSLSPLAQQCTCGNRCRFTRTNIVVNGVRSCGCMKGKRDSPRLGEVHGIFTVVGFVPKPSPKATSKWLVRCRKCQSENLIGKILFSSAPNRCRSCS